MGNHFNYCMLACDMQIQWSFSKKDTIVGKLKMCPLLRGFKCSFNGTQNNALYIEGVLNSGMSF